jgi:nitrite reductase/ring-hydroxylating ferredoxin subunit
MKWFKIAAEDQFQGGNRALLKYDVNGCSELIVVFVHGSNYHAMDAVCPHSGGPLHLGPVELIDIEDSTTVPCLRKEALVCPWHHYKFTVDNGKSVDDDIFSVSTYKIKLIDKCVYIEYHNHGILNQVNIFKRNFILIQHQNQRNANYPSCPISI